MTDQIPTIDYHLEAYKILVELVKHDDNLFWKRNDFVIAINGGMLTILGLLISPATSINCNLKPVLLAICFMGCLINILWLFVAKRSEAFYNHWFEQLEFIEKQYLTSMVIFKTADEYFTKGQITIGEKEFKLDFFSRSLRMFLIVQIMTVLLTIVWVVISGYLLF